MNFRGQWGMMEYIVATFMMLVLIVFLVFFLNWWQVTQIEVQGKREVSKRAMFLMKRFTESPLVAKEKGVLDFSKLLVMSERCEGLKEIFGENFFARVKIMDGRSETICRRGQIDDCNYFQLCGKGEGEYTAYTVPVNIYRRFGYMLGDSVVSRYYPGSLKLGVKSR